MNYIYQFVEAREIQKGSNYAEDMKLELVG